ncbi:MAG: PcfJ domain-containing protein, partial [Candidatus Poribacteria bacterium]
VLAVYDAPWFMDTAWFQGLSDAALLRQDWFVAVATGTNIRKAPDLPIELTKKMAHLLMQAPRTYTIDQALRWTQVVGMGGSQELAEAVMHTRLGQSFDREDFWVSVVKFLVYNPMLDTSYAEPVVTYIHQQKYEPEQMVGDDGAITFGDPPHPGFSMRTRKVDALLAEVDEWRGEREREERVGSGSWSPSGFDPYDEADTDEYGRTRWTIRELTTMRALNLEGKAMRHCVASYARSCRAGSKSVWSLEATNDEGTSRRVMTISVKTTTRMVTQARGKSNAHPLGGHRSGWHRTRLREGYKVMRRWAASAGITVPKHI